MDKIVPGFSELNMVALKSSSNRVIDAKGNHIFPLGGLHVTVEVCPDDNLERWVNESLP